MDIKLSSARTSQVRSLAHQAYLHLREQIVQGDLPPLHKLKISVLAREMNLNSSAVREALSRLTSDNLVEAIDQKGFRVAPISLEELDDITETRVDIETLILMKSIARGDSIWLERVRIAHQSLADAEKGIDEKLSFKLHDKYHQTLNSACGSPSLLSIQSKLYDLSARYRALSRNYAQAIRPVAIEHQEITEAVLARDKARSAAAIAKHIRTTALFVNEAISESLGTAV